MAPIRRGDGTGIGSIRLGDGTEVSEVRLNGQTVFSAGPTLPVAYSDLIAWYPFDSAEYGGSNADDVTAIIGGSGDDTSYNGTFDSSGTTPTYQSSGGATDINAGQNSGAYEFDSSNYIRLPTGGFNWANKSITAWSFSTDLSNDQISLFRGKNGDGVFLRADKSSGFEDQDSNSFGTVSFNGAENVWRHYALTNDGSTVEFFVNGTSAGTDGWPGPVKSVPDLFIGGNSDVENNNLQGSFVGLIDDLRIYNKRLSSSEVNQIISNTPHP